MNEHIERALNDLRVRQQAGEWMPCPRCGRDTLKPSLHTNALSRHADGIYICDECGTAEAMLDFMNNPLPTEMWAMFRVPRQESDLKDLPGEEVWKRIRMEHGPILIDIFKRWTQEAPGASFTLYRWEAFKRCPGLTEIWEQPFQAKYDVADAYLPGTVLLNLVTPGYVKWNSEKHLHVFFQSHFKGRTTSFWIYNILYIEVLWTAIYCGPFSFSTKVRGGLSGTSCFLTEQPVFAPETAELLSNICSI